MLPFVVYKMQHFKKFYITDFLGSIHGKKSETYWTSLRFPICIDAARVEKSMQMEYSFSFNLAKEGKIVLSSLLLVEQWIDWLLNAKCHSFPAFFLFSFFFLDYSIQHSLDDSSNSKHIKTRHYTWTTVFNLQERQRQESQLKRSSFQFILLFWCAIMCTLVSFGRWIKSSIFCARISISKQYWQRQSSW